MTFAKEIANKIPFAIANENSKNKKATNSYVTKTFESIHETKNKNGKTCFYVINYIEGGFVILSADNRTKPILGFSDNNKFIVDENSYPAGLKFWIDDAKKQITEIQNSGIEQTKEEKLAWEKINYNEIIKYKSLTAKTTSEPPFECYEHTEINTVGPLLTSTWYQYGGYNAALPYITCSGNNFQVYAGCVPIAMAQVMKFYEYPNNYSWSSMLLNYATTTTANFIADIHNAISSIYNGYPSYDCNGTGVSSSANMGIVLKSRFNYTSAS